MSYLSFHLPEAFVESYRDRKVDWGYTDAAGNALGEITFLAAYSRKKPCKHDNVGDECACLKEKERWWEVCRRVIEGMFSIQKDWCKENRLPWNDRKAQGTAQEAYERLFTFRWTPPGRGLWMMGTPLVHRDKNSIALQNCSFISTADMTKNDPAYPFAFLMESSMLGIGVGFDNLGAAKSFRIYQPNPQTAYTFTIADSREGWVESTKLLIESYLMPGRGVVTFDYSLIRPAGKPIKTFGGTAAGPEPLYKLHQHIRRLFDGRVCENPDHDPAEACPQLLSKKDIGDIGNLIGVCVVAGNVRRSAELFMGSIDDPEFIRLKDPMYFPERNHWCREPHDGCTGPGWGSMSNNSVSVTVGTDYSPIIDNIALNGEPGVIWMDISRDYGRIIDGPNHKDWRVTGYNPCAEQSLESGECCTLVETYLNRHADLPDFLRTLKFAYMYAKTVTLLPTHWPRTNAIMQRNRRIGASVSGIANFTDRHNMNVLRTWLSEGYAEVQKYDQIYSEWLGVRESIKTTTVKPSGTVSILTGESPGVHWAPGGEYFNRALRLRHDHAMVPMFRQAGYLVEPDVTDPRGTVVVYFPIHSGAKRSDREVTLFEKANLAVLAQRYWSDNSVSVTLSFDSKTEAEHVGTILHMHEGQLKTVSFLPQGNDVYAQMPYTQIDAAQYEEAQMRLFKVDLDRVYAGDSEEAIGERFCSNDVCEVKV